MLWAGALGGNCGGADWACAAVAFFAALLTHDWPHQTGLLLSSLSAIVVGMLLSREGRACE